MKQPPFSPRYQTTLLKMMCIGLSVTPIWAIADNSNFHDAVLNFQSTGAEQCGSNTIKFNAKTNSQMYLYFKSDKTMGLYDRHGNFIADFDLKSDMISNITASFNAFTGNSANNASLTGAIKFDNNGVIKSMRGSFIRRGIINSCYSSGTFTAKYIGDIHTISGSTLGGNISNSGTINGGISGVGTSLGNATTASGISNGGTITGGIINSGTIGGIITNSGVEVIGGGTISGNIGNSGTISENAINFTFTNNTGSAITLNPGDVYHTQTGTITNNSPTAVVIIGTDSTISFISNITGGVINIPTNGTIIINSGSTVIFNSTGGFL